MFLYIAVLATAVSSILIREECAQKLRTYFQSQAIIVLTTFPLRTILHRPSQSGRLAKWAIELSEYDIKYQTKTYAKSQVLEDFLVELPTEDMKNKEPNSTWLLHIDGSSSEQGSGIGVRLTSNNESEYKALVAGLRLAHGLKIRNIHTYCNSQLKFSEPLMTCAEGDKVRKIMEEVHFGSCGNHSGGRSLAVKIKHHGYYWPAMINGCKKFTQKYKKCQRHASTIHQPAEVLSSISSPSLFMRWSMDIVGPWIT
ncbi:hypothetical protein N665_0188s0004 [Sinapis alba]|nr:hypothetical protein N665_0188s0004 [Sinapis alba]